MKAHLKALTKLQPTPKSLLSWWDKLLQQQSIPNLAFSIGDFWRVIASLSEDSEKAELLVSLAESAVANANSTTEPLLLVPDVVSLLRGMQRDDLRIPSAHTISRILLGETQLLSDLEGEPHAKARALQLLLPGLSNVEAFRDDLVERLLFFREHLLGAEAVEEDVWDDVLEASRSLGQWERSIPSPVSGEEVEVIPHAVILGLLGRDFCQSTNSEWSGRFFQTLLSRLTALSPSPEREWALRQVMMGLSVVAEDEPENIADWMTQVLQISVTTSPDPSLIYEGMFLGFVGNHQLGQASRVALRIPDLRLRDQAFVRLIQEWLRLEKPVEAMSALQEIQDASLRGSEALRLGREAVVVANPVAASVLMEVASRIPFVAQRVLRRIVENPAFPEEARQAILEESPRKPLSFSARRERLLELSLLREHLPEDVYRERRRRLLGLKDANANPFQETPGTQIVVDCPIAYGEGHYKTPRDHVQHNHFGAKVGGSLVTEWESFDSMWEDIQGEVQQRVQSDGSVQVIELCFPIDIGVTGLIPLESAPPDRLGMESRNGHPSLFCDDNAARKETHQLTVVVGPSEVGADELPGYEGHQHSCVLYTVYPGEPAPPFPSWEEGDLPQLESATAQALQCLQVGDVTKAQEILYTTLVSVSHMEEPSRFWSEHLLVK
ncbi:MAG: hypothetical protein EP343_16370 [Deltaproteobacteria bacterium]|nr:MAG: hypothetical protein EP343_16370 [Deltaproteobacteria bacterium]